MKTIYKICLFLAVLLLGLAIYAFCIEQTVLGFVELLFMLFNLPFAVMLFKKNKNK